MHPHYHSMSGPSSGRQYSRGDLLDSATISPTSSRSQLYHASTTDPDVPSDSASVHSYGSGSGSGRTKHSRGLAPRLRQALSHVHLPTASRSQTPTRHNSSENLPQLNVEPPPPMPNFSRSQFGTPVSFSTGPDDDDDDNQDDRRPSYTSQTTQSSTSSYQHQHPQQQYQQQQQQQQQQLQPQSQHHGSVSQSPLQGPTSLPQNFDPSELSMLTSLPPSSAVSLDPNTSNYQMSFPDPEQVEDHSAASSRSASVASSYADSMPPQQSDPHHNNHHHHHKRLHKKSFLGKLIARRESSADLRDSKSSSSSRAGVRHRPSEASMVPIRAAGSTRSSMALNNSRKNENGRQRSRSSSTTSKPLPSIPPELAEFHFTPLPGSNQGTLYQLDTDTNQMHGIVNSSGPSTTDNYQPVASGAIPPGPTSQNAWVPPESWGVAINSAHGPKVESEYKPVNLSSKPVRPQRQANHCLRVFRDDGTFGTLSCSIDITVAELLQMLGRKFFLNSTQGFQLSMRTGGLTRILAPHERPLVQQKLLLEFMGYGAKDRLFDVGREDLSYLCRFEFSRASLRNLTAQEEALVSRSFAQVSLPRMGLQTIPILFYQHAVEIEYLDVSQNPSISIPLDFIQGCINLTTIKFVGNRATSFPPNIHEAVKLSSVDLSNNLILDLDQVDFNLYKNLTGLNLLGNRLCSVPESIVTLQQLRYLNLSSNNLMEIPDSICDIPTLTQLNISFNHIKYLPDDFGRLTSLEKLLMSNNELTKRLPRSFGNLKSLRELDIRYNKLQNIDILSRLPNLETLLCSKNQVYSFEHSLPKLKLFYFDRNPITRIEFTDILSTLTVVNLSKAKLTGLPESFIDRVPMVEKLILDKNHLGTLPPRIGSLRQLIYLSVVDNQLSILPPEIGLLQELRTLDVHSNNLKSLPEEIWSLSSLSVLNASSNLLEALPKPNLHHASVSSASGPRSQSIGQINELESDYEMRHQDRRDSQALSPKNGSSRRGSDQNRPHPASGSSSPGHMRSSPTSPVARSNSAPEPDSMQMAILANTPVTYGARRGGSMSQSLLVLSLGDNRLNDEVFEQIAKFTELEVLNLSYNDLVEVPPGALGRLTRLTELYLSGNRLNGLPADDFENNKALNVFHVNANKLHSLPAELGKMTHLSVLDVGSNNLRYNINNWPYDWNWNFNLALRYLNLSGNQKLEIKTLHNQAHRGEKNLSDFTSLTEMRVLGLMDVTLTTPSVPDQTENCRVRTYGSYLMSMKYGMADSIGHHENLSMTDMVIERFRGNEKEAVIGLFDGRNENEGEGNKVCKLVQESFGNIFSEELGQLREDETVADALRRAFLHTNKEIGNTTLLPTEEIAHSSIAHRSSTAANVNPHDHMTGSCATVVYMVDNKVYVANVGDSMAVLSKGNGEYTVLTERHDPTSQSELARIRGGGGSVSSTGKLDGVLDVSRAIGFYNLVPHIHAAPYISEYELTGADDFLILASKQLWEYITYEMAADVARTELDNPMLAAQKLRDFAIAYGCRDKLMVMVLAIGSRNKKKTFGRAVGGNISNASNRYALSEVEEELFPALVKKRRDKSLLPEDSTLARLGGEVEPPVGDVAMVFTDIKNSTLLWETYPVAMRSAIKVHNSIMRRHIRIMGGYEVKTEGDAFIVSFPTPTSALLWCFSVQSQLLVADWPTEILESREGYEITDDNGEILFRGLSVRMGIHWGSPVSETDVITKRMDYFGPMVNRTARISAVADGGEITLSSDFLLEVRQLEAAHKKVQEENVSIAEAYGDSDLGYAVDRDVSMLKNLGWVVHDLGEMKLKGLENPELISVAYPKSLQGRWQYHKEAREAAENAKSKDSFQPKSGTEVVHQVPQAHRIGNLTLDILLRLREVSNRLEKICSLMNSGGTGGQDAMGRYILSTYNTKTSKNLMAVIPNTDEDYALFFEHIVTRVENAITTLYLRATVGEIEERYANNRFQSDLSEMLMSLRETLEKLRPVT